MGREFLRIQPGDLHFSAEPSKRCSTTFTVQNIAGTNVAFKVRTTMPRKYAVQPNKGIIPHRGQLEISVTMQAVDVVVSGLQPKDKFLIQSVAIIDDINQAIDWIATAAPKTVASKELKVFYKAPHDVIEPELSEEEEEEEIDEVYYPHTAGPMRPSNGEDFREMGAPLPSDESSRLAALKRLNLLDTDLSPKFNCITDHCKAKWQMQMSLISLVDTRRQFFKANSGLEGVCETSRESSFCAFTLLPSRDPCLIVENATTDTRFNQNPLVTGPPDIRFYGGAPLLTSDGYILGALCTIDNNPRKFSKTDRNYIVAMSQLAIMEIEHSAWVNELLDEIGDDEEKPSEEFLTQGTALIDFGQDGGPVTFMNVGWEELTGYSPDEVVSSPFFQTLAKCAEVNASLEGLKAVIRKGRSVALDVVIKRKDGSCSLGELRMKPSYIPGRRPTGQSLYYATLKLKI